MVFSRNKILIRAGNGAKDRTTMLPKSLNAILLDHLQKVEATQEKNLLAEWGNILFPGILDCKYRNLPRDWRGQ